MRRRRRAGSAGNTMILTTGTIVQTIVALVTVPLYLTQLGQERFGVWVIAGLVIAYFGLLDRGFSTAVQAEVARLGEDIRERSSIVWTAVAFNAAVGLSAGLAVLVIGEIIFARVLNIPDALRTESMEALPELAAPVPLVSVMAIFQGVLIARGRVATVSGLETFRLLSVQLIPLGFVYAYGPDLRWLALGVLVALAASWVLYFAACLWLTLRPVSWSRPTTEIARRLFHFGKWVTVTSILTPLLDYSDRVIIGVVRGASTVTAYSIPYNLTARLTIIPLNVIRVTFPQFSAAGAERSHSLATKALASVAAVTAPAAVFGAIISGPFFEWWLGGNLARQAAPVAAVLFAGFWINGVGYVPYALLQAQGRPDIPARYHMLELGPFLLVLGAGVYFGGAMGGAIAWSFRTLVDALLLLSAASLPWHTRVMLASGAFVAAAAVVGAVFAKSALMLAILGTPLVIGSLVVAWWLAPEEFRDRVRGVRKHTVSPVADGTMQTDEE